MTNIFSETLGDAAKLNNDNVPLPPARPLQRVLEVVQKRSQFVAVCGLQDSVTESLGDTWYTILACFNANRQAILENIACHFTIHHDTAVY